MELSGLMKTHHCGQLTKAHVGQGVVLCGWINKYRNLGGMTFLDLRDHTGVAQLSFTAFSGDLAALKNWPLESVILARGEVCLRPPEAVNRRMSTGEVELLVSHVELLSGADRMPFLPHGQVLANEDFRLRYRYIDLRSEKLQHILRLRSRSVRKIREFFYPHGFIEVDTPMLYKSTPEGARDYIVPSRTHRGKVYALPQSPQTLKQLLMIGGADRYFQICKCFRDEDLRADRQPEFSQVDVEVAFATQDYIKNLTTDLLKEILPLPKDFCLPTLTYQEAMERYGTDKPDLRFALPHLNVTKLFIASDLEIFSTVARNEGLIKAIFVPRSAGDFSRKELDGLSDVVKPLGGKGVAWFKVQGKKTSGGIAKFIADSDLERLQALSGGGEDGVYLFCADLSRHLTHLCSDVIRRHLGKTLHLIGQEYQLLWVNHFPLLEYSEQRGRFEALHHPFTRPLAADRETFFTGDHQQLTQVRADAYDLVINGHEVAGGSMRIYDPQMQSRMFEVLGFSGQEAQRQFGFFVEALRYGTPPHGGIAFGLDRLIMLLAKVDNIRDVMAFPKTTSASDLMSGAPSEPEVEQLGELGIKF